MNKDRKRITLDQLREWVGNEGYPQHEQDMCNHFLEILNGDYKVEECRSDVLGYFGNSKEDILADKDQQAEDDYWDNHPEEAKKPPLDENLEKVILGAFKKVFPERFASEDNENFVAVGVQLTELAETPANALHYGNVDDLTIAEIMGMDNNFNLFKGKADLIDKLRDYLLDNLAVRKHMGYDWSLDNE